MYYTVVSSVLKVWFGHCLGLALAPVVDVFVNSNLVASFSGECEVFTVHGVSLPLS